MLMIVFTGNNTLIGEFEGDVMTTPRQIQLLVGPNKQTLLRLDELFGHPKEITIKHFHVCYEVKDEELRKIYLQVTTGIQLSGTLPPGILMRDQGGRG
jgi:hypothetical protein